MADVFISYAREDLDRARALATAFEARGWSVWWDRRIVAGETFDQTIERELESANSVVVLWSTNSIQSEWTKNEATVAAERGVLVPALLDDVRIPLEFRRKQTANLLDWDGASSHEGFQALCEGVAGRIGRPAAPVRVAAPPHDDVRGSRREWWRNRTVVGIAALAVVAVAVGLSMWGSGANVGAGRQTGIPGKGEPARPPVATTGTGPDALDVATRDVRDGPPADANGTDNPAPLTLGAVRKVALETNADYYWQLAAPASTVRIVMDMRGPGGAGTLQSRLSLLDPQGGVVELGLIRFSEHDIGSRKTATVAIKQPNPRIRVLNTGPPVDIWLAALAADAPPFIPLFGSLVPRPMAKGPSATGELAPGTDVYYTVRLAPGHYVAIVDLANPKKELAALSGPFSVLDADGGGERRLIRFSETDTQRRGTAPLIQKEEGARIFRLFNTGAPVRYSIRIDKVK